MLCIETADGRLGRGRTDWGGVFAAKPLLQYCTIKQPSAAELLVFMDAITALRITGQSRSSGHITVRDDPARSIILRPVKLRNFDNNNQHHEKPLVISYSFKGRD